MSKSYAIGKSDNAIRERVYISLTLVIGNINTN